jgi:hypothetical protein
MKTNDLTGEQTYWHGMRPTIRTRNIPLYWKNVYRRGGDEDENNDA